jgi:hypothetical protein
VVIEVNMLTATPIVGLTSVQSLMHIHIHVKRLLFLWDFRQNLNNSTNFSKNPKYQFSRISARREPKDVLFAHTKRFEPNILFSRLPTKIACNRTWANFALEQATQAQRGVEVLFYSFFNLGSRWGGWSTPRPAALPPGKRLSAHFIGGWLGPMSVLDG